MSFLPELIVVIPSFNEVSLIETLQSLEKSSVLEIPTEVIVIFNAPQNADKLIKQRNKKAYEQCQAWSKNHSNNYFKVTSRIYNDLNPKTAGVGMARKIGMDEAAQIFESVEKNGIIVALDADCIVQSNYILEIYSYFSENPTIQACNIYFEHRFEEEDEMINEAAIEYEMHLRYFRQAQRYIGYPYSFHTVGSSMAVTSDIYVKSRGMNTRKAGEDFYFLQKLFSQYNFGVLNSTCVYPLGRLSDRVPFGTGAALNKWDENGRNHIQTYAFDSFLVLRTFLNEITSLGSVNSWEHYFNNSDQTGLRDFLEKESFFKSFKKVLDNTKNLTVIQSQFFRWFNNFKLLKCLNYLRDSKFPSESVLVESGKLLQAMSLDQPATSLDMLALFRNLDKLNN